MREGRRGMMEGRKEIRKWKRDERIGCGRKQGRRVERCKRGRLEERKEGSLREGRRQMEEIKLRSV